MKVISAVNFTNEPQEISTEKSRYVYTGRWSVFNDPNLDQSIIPDDEDQREGLRVGLLVAEWGYLNLGGSLWYGVIMDNSKLVTYYHTYHVNQSEPFLVCQPVQLVGTPQFYFCSSYTKEEIDKMDNKGTFQYIWKFQREDFLCDIIILPLISLIGIFGISFFIFILFYTYIFFKIFMLF